jgi:aspartyl-tRNA(Asn)/glutamyl-tRNA(Gln) amidotransferase subunit C
MLTEADIDRVAHLARLSISDEERARYARQLSEILGYADALAALDLTDIPPTVTAAAVASVTREGDGVDGMLPRPALLRNAPQADGEHFVVQAALGDGGG